MSTIGRVSSEVNRPQRHAYIGLHQIKKVFLLSSDSLRKKH